MTTAYERAVARSAGMPLGGHMTAESTVAEFTGHNGGPPLTDPEPTPFDLVVNKIDDLYFEAKNWADGEPITSAEIAEAVTALFDGLGAAGREAEALRVAEKAPLDKQVDAIQARFNPYVQPKKGKVALGREALGALLTAWRTEQARLSAIAAQKARDEAAALAAEAMAALQASSGNLEAREAAEEIVGFAKQAEKFARGKEKAATTGLGLRTTWLAVLVDEPAALDWAYQRDPGRFRELVQQMGDEAARAGVRAAGGFTIEERKVAA